MTDEELYKEADRIQQGCIDEYDEEMIDNIFKGLKEKRDDQDQKIPTG